MKSLDILLDLRVVAFAQSAQLPRRFKLLGWGDNATASGRKVHVGRKTLAVLADTQKQTGYEEIALDFEHCTVPGTRAYKESAEPRPVAAYGTLDVVENEGVFFDVSRWTPKGEAEALNFQDLSPAVATDENGEVVFIHSVALCRNGDIDGLKFVTLSVTEIAPATMDYRKLLVTLLQLPDDAPDDEIKKAVDAVLGLQGGPMSPLSARVEALTAEVRALKEMDTQRRRDAVCARAAAEGKVIPLSAAQIARMDPDLLDELVSKLPAIVPLHRRTPAVESLSPPGACALIAQYNAIPDPEGRAKFFNANRARILGEG
ncbi:phage protease [Thermosphaera sp.]